MVKELKEHLDLGQLVEPIEETKTLLAEIHKGQGDSLKDIKVASKGHEDTLREVKAVSSKMKAAAKEDATYQASLRQYLEKVEKKVLEQDAKNFKSLSEGIREVCEAVKGTAATLQQQQQQQQQQHSSAANSDEAPAQPAKRAGKCNAIKNGY